MNNLANRGPALAVFPSELGWMAMLSRGGAVARLVFGCESPRDALAELGFESVRDEVGQIDPRLVKRLQAFARGAADDFRDVKIDVGDRTPFQRQVVARCRRIPYGRTATYASLATAAGYPRASRAVGTVMSTNRIPLIIPCHRVLSATGLGGYSGRLGLTMKKRLIALEAQAATRRPPRPRKTARKGGNSRTGRKTR
jgi:methylated-DNA-[protein]-cysteine S-methyltransferase